MSLKVRKLEEFDGQRTGEDTAQRVKEQLSVKVYKLEELSMVKEQVKIQQRGSKNK